MRIAHLRTTAGLALLGAGLVLAGCGDRGGSSTNNTTGTLTGGTNDFTIGNDASAMESVGSNTGMSAQPLPMPTGNASGEAAPGNSAAPADAAGGSSAGGDRGGNTVESNVAGM